MKYKTLDRINTSMGNAVITQLMSGGKFRIEVIDASIVNKDRAIARKGVELLIDAKDIICLDAREPYYKTYSELWINSCHLDVLAFVPPNIEGSWDKAMQRQHEAHYGELREQYFEGLLTAGDLLHAYFIHLAGMRTYKLDKLLLLNEFYCELAIAEVETQCNVIKATNKDFRAVHLDKVRHFQAMQGGTK